MLDPNRQPFRTSDGYLSNRPPIPTRTGNPFFSIADRRDVLEDERFSTYRNRTRNIGELYSIVATITPSRTTAEWMQLLENEDIPVMRVNQLEDLIHDEHLKQVGFFKERIHPTEGRYLEMQPPVRFSAWQPGERRFPPNLGEHTAEVLTELDVVANE